MVAAYGPLKVLIHLMCPIVIAHPHFTLLLPNGNNIFHKGNLVAAIGHTNPRGHGALNRFGKDFASAGFTWTRSFCEKDSDQDSIPNGVELGDPFCVWSRGEYQQFGSANIFLEKHFGLVLSHPGIPGTTTLFDNEAVSDEYLLASARSSEFRYAVKIRHELRARQSYNSFNLVDFIVIIGCNAKDVRRAAVALEGDDEYQGRVYIGDSYESGISAIQNESSSSHGLAVTMVSINDLDICQEGSANKLEGEPPTSNFLWHSPIVIHTNVWSPEAAALWMKHLVAPESHHCEGSKISMEFCVDASGDEGAEEAVSHDDFENDEELDDDDFLDAFDED